ncbi:hypothetical protein GCM10010449_11140 [Streptomyces rectiviolaceus]|uniref:Uncharacterized protein n=1 Tax=Streptomyces rectiviolaceus TaxID=332591 RepID=A0ABP6MAC9_9ACTN
MIWKIFIVVGAVVLFVAVCVGAAKWRKKSINKTLGLSLSAAALAVVAFFGIEGIGEPGSPSTGDASSRVSITYPRDAGRVQLCLRTLEGVGRAPSGSSLWLLVRGSGNTNYYLARRIPDDPDSQGWTVGNVQVGNAETEPGQRYELVVWKFDARLTDVATHFSSGAVEFSSRPPGAQHVAKRIVIRAAATERDRC